MKINTLASLFLWLMILAWPFLAAAEPTGEEAAVQAAESWLAVIDGGKYAESWDGAAAFFRNAVPKEQWVGSMNAFRKPLGGLIERKLTSRQYMTSLPGAPDGEYVVLQFNTTFENKQASVETVTPMLDGDGAWRVSGYFIK